MSWIADLEKTENEIKTALGQVNYELYIIEDKLNRVEKFLELNFTEFDIAEAASVEQCDKYKFIIQQLTQLDYNCMTAAEYGPEYYQIVLYN